MNCDICGGDSTPWKQLQDARYDTTPEKAFMIYECKDCGTGKTSPVPDDLDPYYPDRYYDIRTKEQEQTPRSTLLDAYAERMSPDGLLPDRPGRLLEVGCGPGQTLAEYERAGWTVEGVELNQHAVELGREIYGLDLYNGTLTDVHETLSALQPFDVILLEHVFEHIPNPHETVTQCRQLLDDDGRLIIEVPNFDSISRRLLGEYWEDHDVPRHLYHYTPESLDQLLMKHGFELAEESYDNRGQLFAGWLADYLSAKGPVQVPTATVYPFGLIVGQIAGTFQVSRFRKSYAKNRRAGRKTHEKPVDG